MYENAHASFRLNVSGAVCLERVNSADLGFAYITESAESIVKPNGGRNYSSMSSVIKIDPQVLSGTPVFEGTRVPVSNLFDYIEAGESIDEFLDAFPSVTKEQILNLLSELKHTAIDAKKQHCFERGRYPFNGWLFWRVASPSESKLGGRR